MTSRAARSNYWRPVVAGAGAAALGIACTAWYLAAVDWTPGTEENGSAIAAGSATAQSAGACGRCGVIEAVRKASRTRNPPAVASVTGGQAGEMIAVLHMVMNAMGGNRSGDSARTAQSYEVVVRFHDGSTRTLTQAGAPSWNTGDPVKVINGRIEPDA